MMNLWIISLNAILLHCKHNEIGNILVNQNPIKKMGSLIHVLTLTLDSTNILHVFVYQIYLMKGL